MYLAEYLPRLKQVSVKVEVGTSESIEAVSLAENVLLIRTPTSTVEVPLPVSHTASTKPTGYSFHDGVLSMTFSTASDTKGSSTFMELARSNAQLWSVSDLVAKTPRDSKNVNIFQFCCSNCHAVIIDSKSLKFIDMPSEFWQEMMDFWHCHKPHEHHHNENDKNYNGKIQPLQNQVYIGSYYLLLSGQSEKCEKCGSSLGIVEQGSTKLYKWRLNLCYKETRETYPPFAAIFYLILDKVNSSAIRKFTFKTKSASTNIWVLNLGLSVSVAEVPVLKNALKIFYIENPAETEDEVVEVPEEVYASFITEISLINSRMPSDCQEAEMKVDEDSKLYKVSYLVSRHGSSK